MATSLIRLLQFNEVQGIEQSDASQNIDATTIPESSNLKTAEQPMCSVLRFFRLRNSRLCSAAYIGVIQGAAKQERMFHRCS